jgi:hypothetical protein
MQNILTTEEISQLVTTGIVELTDDLMIRLHEVSPGSYEDSDWYNDPNCVMSRHHYWISTRCVCAFNLDENAHNHHTISTRMHTNATRFMHNNSHNINAIGYTIKFQSPYNSCQWRTQSFATIGEAQRMIQFYRSCGSPAELIKWMKNESIGYKN